MFSYSFAYFCFQFNLPRVNILSFFYDEGLELATNNVRLFSYNSLRSATEHFHPSNKIGGGGFGVVYKVRLVNLLVLTIFDKNYAFNREKMSY